MESIYLHGSEDVKNAAHTMRSAAEDMNRAANNLAGYLDQHQRFMSQWLDDFRSIMEAAQPKKEP